MSRPPRLARWLLGRLLPDDLAEPVLGDLEEEYARRRARGPLRTDALRAGAWYWSQALRSVPAAMGLRRLRRRPGRGMMGGDIARGIRFAMRGMRRSPGFAALVILTLALGIGANATIFSVADRVLLQPPDQIRDPDRVVQIFFDRKSLFRGDQEVSPAATYPDYLDLEEVDGFASVAGYSTSTRTLGSGETAERVRTQLAGGSLFTLLGASPALGRFFGPDDDAVGAAEPVAVLSHPFWTRRFGADPDILGRELRLGEGRYTVVGVAAPGFTGPTIEPVDVWVPLTTGGAIENGTQWQDARGWYWFRMVARLADGVAPEAAADQATAAHRVGRALLIAEGRYDAEVGVALGSIVPGRALDAGGEVAVTRWLVGVALVVLLIASANVANLLLVRGVRWRRELAIRRALGVSEASLVTMLLTEIGILAGLAAAAAVACAVWGGAFLFRTLLPDVQGAGTAVGPRLLGFTALAAVLTTLLAGLVPTLGAVRGDLEADLRSGATRRPSTGRVRAALLVAQVSMSAVLLVGAGLFVRSLVEVQRLDLGFEPDDVYLGTVETGEGSSPTTRSQALSQAAERLRGAPGVRFVARASLVPFRGLWGRGFRPEGTDSLSLSTGPFYYVVDPDYFRAMGMTVVRGRGLAERDMAEGATPVAVLTEDLASHAFPGEEAVGRCIYVEDRDAPELPCTTVVGILVDHRSTDLRETDSPLYYTTPAHPADSGSDYQILVVKGDSDALDLSTRIRETLLESPGVRFASVAPARDGVDLRARPWRLGAVLFGVFGALALLVASLGLYALLAFDVAQRRRDLAVRSALGAPSGRLFGAVVGRAVGLTAIGVAIGLATAAFLTGSLESLLFRVEGVDPGVMAVVAVTLLAVAVAATLLPASRAANVPPGDVLRSE